MGEHCPAMNVGVYTTSESSMFVFCLTTMPQVDLPKPKDKRPIVSVGPDIKELRNKLKELTDALEKVVRAHA